jgi:hypothetical protein
MKKPLDSKFKLKRIESQKLTMRDQTNNCRVSGIFNINNEIKMIIMSSKKNVYLIDSEKKISKMSIKKWNKKFKCEIDDKKFASIWDKSIYRRLRKFRKKEIQKKVNRSPVKKKIKRQPLKKIKRRPAK